MRYTQVTVGDILREIQHDSSPQMTKLKELQDLYQNSDDEKFLKDFKNCLLNIFMQDYKEKNVHRDRCMNFCATFCILLNNEEELTDPLLADVFMFTIVCIKSHTERIRYGGCELIFLLLTKIGQGYLDDYIYESLIDPLLARIEDVKSAIRKKAILCLQFFQTPADLDDPVTLSMVNCIYDSNPQVRRVIVSVLCINRISYPALMERCTDTESCVRLAVYEKFSTLGVNGIPIHYRQKLLRNGFRDEKQKIKTFVSTTFVKNWMTYYKEDIYQFMHALKLDGNEEELKQTMDIYNNILNAFLKNNSLKKLIDCLPLNNDKVISEDNVSWEVVFCWRYLVEFLKLPANKDSKDTEEFLDQITPDLVEFGKFVKRTYDLHSTEKSPREILHFEYLLIEMFKVLLLFDYSDEVGRSAILKLMNDILMDTKVSYIVVEKMLELFEKIIPNPEERVIALCTVISDIQEPLAVQELDHYTIRARDVKIAELEVKIHISVDEQEMAVRKEDFELAHKIKLHIAALEQKIEEVKEEYRPKLVKHKSDDPALKSACLDIVQAMLRAPTIRTLLPSLRLLLEQLINPLLAGLHPDLYSKAVKCLCMFCYVDRELTIKSFHKIYAPILSYALTKCDIQPILLISISSITDLMLLYGVGIFEDINNMIDSMNEAAQFFEGEPIETLSCKQVIETIAAFMDDETSEIRQKAGQSLIKLIANGVIQSPPLLVKLILKWFNPLTEKDTWFRQTLGQMIVYYITEIPESLEVIEKSVVPVLMAVVDAPNNSPLLQIDLDSMLRFLAEITRAGRNKHNETTDCHKNLLLLLCSNVLDEPDSKYVDLFLRMLLVLDIPYDDIPTMQNLYKMANDMLQQVVEKPLLRRVTKFIQKLNKLDFNSTTTTASNTNIQTAESTMQTLSSNSDQNLLVTSKPVKRRKRASRKSQNDLSILTYIQEEQPNKIPEEESSSEDDNVSIQSYGSSEKSNPPQSAAVISETDSDFD